MATKLEKRGRMIAREIKASTGSFGCHRKLKAALISVITSPLFIPRGALPLALARILLPHLLHLSRSPVALAVAPPRGTLSCRCQKLHQRRELFIRLQRNRVASPKYRRRHQRNQRATQLELKHNFI